MSTQLDNKWGVFEIDNVVHIVPLNDLREHQHTSNCWCCPRIDEEDNMIIHNSVDGREKYERVERLPS